MTNRSFSPIHIIGGGLAGSTAHVADGGFDALGGERGGSRQQQRCGKDELLHDSFLLTECPA